MPLLPENSSVPVTSPLNASEMRKAWSHPIENVHQISELSVDALIHYTAYYLACFSVSVALIFCCMLLLFSCTILLGMLIQCIVLPRGSFRRMK